MCEHIFPTPRKLTSEISVTSRSKGVGFNPGSTYNSIYTSKNNTIAHNYMSFIKEKLHPKTIDIGCRGFQLHRAVCYSTNNTVWVLNLWYRCFIWALSCKFLSNRRSAITVNRSMFFIFFLCNGVFFEHRNSWEVFEP